MYGCRRCSEETNETEPCNAPIRDFKAGYQTYQKPSEPVGHEKLIPGTDKYFEALNKFAIELTEEKKITVIQAYVEAVKKGWSLQGFEIEEEVQKALEEAGLSTPESGVSSTTVAPEVQVQALPSGPVQEPIGLDEIIKGMQEEQK